MRTTYVTTMSNKDSQDEGHTLDRLWYYLNLLLRPYYNGLVHHDFHDSSDIP